MKNPTKEGSRGCSPWVASPSGGERGSPSQLPQRISKLPEKEDFNNAFFPGYHTGMHEKNVFLV
jgi:hypothetical protein